MMNSTASSVAQTQANNPANFTRGGGVDRSLIGELLQLMSSSPDDLRIGPDMLVAMRRLRAGDTLFHQGARAEAIYFVRAGTFKTFRIAEDGYEQVLGFSGRAEVLGFDAVCMGQYPTEAVALEESSVFTVPMPDTMAPGSRFPGLDRMVTLAASRALTQRGELADVMAAVAAEVRLARFMVQLSRRMEACGQSPRRFHLRMSRRDIASHLGVAHETVSRSFHALMRWQLLQVKNREVEILDMEGLKTLSRSTRRQVDEFGATDGARRPATGNGNGHGSLPEAAVAEQFLA